MASQRCMGDDFNPSPSADGSYRDHERTGALAPHIVVTPPPNRRSLRMLIVAHTGIPPRRRLELMQDAALRRTIGGTALAAQGDELALEHLQGVETRADTGELGVDQRVDLSTVGCGVVHEAQQLRDVGQGNVQCPAVADEREALKVPTRVGPISIGAAGRRREQTDPLVVADGFDLDVRGLGQFTDLHRLHLLIATAQQLNRLTL